MTKFQPFTLLLQGGHVIDSANSIDGQMDVAIKGDAIAEVSPAIDPSRSEQVLNVEGLYVTPGLVDMHTHHFAYIKWSFLTSTPFPTVSQPWWMLGARVGRATKSSKTR